ncbi:MULTISPECIES: hypothetical protein [unclassified Clostridium]|uniref:hypothetical protein n=1 Tax=unclassified Clostridium TaxID=2614128 RepID=UPI0002979066|nr:MULTISPECIES: hypothetical protein [unclassified Clostridium]EKQ54452.1 MAG: hypothetical protein A370_03276 [Clostridium sp. Maddingley MBC34-26]
MKKSIILFLIFLCVSFSIFKLKSAFATDNIYTQGIYKVSNFGKSKNHIYTIENIQSQDNVYVTILDENLNVIEGVRLLPKSPKIDTIPVKDNFKVVIVGKGEVKIFPKD